MVKIVALAGTLAHTGEDGEAAMLLGNVVDEFENDDGLADACAAETADFAALRKRRDKVDDLDPGLDRKSVV